MKRTVLYEEHLKLAKRMLPFAGWEMPVWYESALDEHRAVRETCALFDVSHMGVLEISGAHAADFLDFTTTNLAGGMQDGGIFHACMADAPGNVLDDLMVYKMADRFLMIVNAANEDKDWAWLNQVNSGEAVTGPDNQRRRTAEPVTLRNLKDPANGADCRVGLALQGPRSLDVLMRLVDSAEVARLKSLQKKMVGGFTVAGLPVILSRTGYTGEVVGFEILVHPDKAPELWNILLTTGAEFGIKPAGLAARDSTRTEYGLPLYGHEIEGPLAVTPGGSGFGRSVKFDKPFFIGKEGLLRRETARDKQIVRFAVSRQGARPVRTNDLVFMPGGGFAGHVTSCVALPDRSQVGLAYVGREHTGPGPVSLFALRPGDRNAGPASVDSLPGLTEGLDPIEANIVSRFQSRKNTI